ncbi:Double-strand-break repair protein rad21 homolog [Eumeta japonica]|uniref:Double-strand-break repair protein rad21 homolog n=1 Tax=Eumeta variegata TaxID=151549 RepID=A0A4C1WCR7_EUMVA|nr:Double-strand-break repair protein rad21 homolog [Eumeta japonica]
MFYAHFVLAKKGPLAKIWLAAHWDKKLTKAHVFETNIEKSVDGILKPKVKMALRTSGHLLLGVVRIYSRKAKYLLQDCNEAFVKIKMAFRPGMVDLPEEHREAAMNAITLPEVFHDFDTPMPELNEVDIEAQFSLNQSRAEEITMREDYGSLNLVTHDDGFGDMGFDTDNPDIMREAIGTEGALEQSQILFADGSSLELTKEGAAAAGVPALAAPEHERRMEAAPHTPIDDGFGGTIGDVADFGPDFIAVEFRALYCTLYFYDKIEDIIDAGGLFEGDLFGDVTAGSATAGSAPGMPGSSAQPQSLQAEIEAAGVSGVEGTPAPAAVEGADSDDDMDDRYDAGASPQHSWGGSPPHELATRAMDAGELMPPPEPRPPSVRSMEVDGIGEVASAEPEVQAADVPPPQPDHDNTTILQNEEESFALAPVDATVLKGITKTKRKRKLIVDEVKNISGEEMKNQLSNTSDIVTTLDLAPPTRRLMHWKETGGVEKLFTLPARSIPSRVLFKKYQRNMTIRAEGEELEQREPEAARRRSPDQEQPTVSRRSTRKRKHEEMVQQEVPVPTPALVQPPTPAPAPTDVEPPTPAPQEYEPSVGMLSTLGAPLTPGVLGPLTPGTLLQGGITPAQLRHGAMTPGGLPHGGMTPVGLAHGECGPSQMDLGGMTPGPLSHSGLGAGGMTPTLGIEGGLTPGGLVHGGLTPAGLQHGGMTPGGLDHGMTPSGLVHGGMTPGGLGHGGMTPVGLSHGGMTPAGLAHGGMTPSLHGALLQPGAEMPMMPQLGGDQVSSLLGTDSAVHSYHPAGMQMANLGYDETQPHSPQHDYDLPPSVEHPDEGEREAGETDEQFEERVLNRRAAQLFAQMRPRLTSGTHIAFRDLAPPHNNRKQVAQKFYSLLVLKKHQVLTLEQEESYGPIIINKGSQFDTEAI